MKMKMALLHLIALCMLLWCADLMTCGDNPPDIRTSQGVMESIVSIDCRAGSHVTAGMSKLYGIELECTKTQGEKRVWIAKSKSKSKSNEAVQMQTNHNVSLTFNNITFDALLNSDNAGASFLTVFFIDWPIKSSVNWSDCECVFHSTSNEEKYNVTPITVNYSKLVCSVSQEHAVKLSIIRRTEKSDMDIVLTPTLSLPTTSSNLTTFRSSDGPVVYRVDNTSTISVLTAFVPNVQDQKFPYLCSIMTLRKGFNRPFAMTSHPMTSQPTTVSNTGTFNALNNEKEENNGTLVAVAAVVSLLTLAVGFIIGYMLGKRQDRHRLPINDVLTSVDSVLHLSSTNSDHTTSTLLSGTHSTTEQV